MSKLLMTTARTVQASVLGARPAGLRDPLLQRLASPEDPHGGVARRQPLLLSKGLDRRAGDLDRLERVRVLGLQARSQASDACADLTGHLGSRGFLRFKLSCEGVRSPIGGTSPAELIDRRIPQRSIEPWNDRFVSWRLLWSCHELGERVLQDVLGDGPIAHPALQVPQKRAMVLQEQSDGRRGLAIRSSSVVRHRDQYRRRDRRRRPNTRRP